MSTSNNEPRLTIRGLRRRSGWELHPGVRTGRRLSRAERAADAARDALGSWTFICVLTAGTVAAAVWAFWHDRHVGAVTVLDLVLSGLTLLEVSLVLMAIRRHDRAVGEQALYDLDVTRRAAAAANEAHTKLEELHTEIARLAARVEVSRRPPSSDDDEGGQGGRAVLGWRP
jgi:uncharacterized membrane protein